MSGVKWDLVELKCAACGADMEPVSGPWGVFYQCKNAHPSQDGEAPCFNRMNSDMYENILNKITELLTQTEDAEDMNYTGFKWTLRTSYQHFRFRIQKQSSNHFIIQVGNMKKCKCTF